MRSRPAGAPGAQYVRTGKVQNSLVERPDAQGRLTTIITGTGTFAELAAFAETLRPVRTSG